MSREGVFIRSNSGVRANRSHCLVGMADYRKFRFRFSEQFKYRNPAASNLLSWFDSHTLSLLQRYPTDFLRKYRIYIALNNSFANSKKKKKTLLHFIHSLLFVAFRLRNHQSRTDVDIKISNKNNNNNKKETKNKNIVDDLVPKKKSEHNRCLHQIYVTILIFVFLFLYANIISK